jgi:NAD+ synthase (glutamine-hydrolysing)
MSHHGFLRVAAAVPQLRISDCAYNVERILALMQQAETEQVAVLVFPELCLTGYTCADLFQQLPLQRAAVEALGQLIRRSEAVFSGLAVVGVPLGVDDQLFNCAALVHRGRILGVVPKSFIPNYKEFYEARWFAAAATARSREIVFDGVRIPFGTNFLFEASDIAGLVVGVEICEDLWVPMPPSSFQALHGATLLVNLSASNEVIGKASYRKQLVLNQSGRCLAAYVYASCGVWESTTDVVFGGHCLIAENGTLLAESRRFQHRETLLVADIDLDRLRYERLRTNSYSDAGLYSSVDRSFTRLSFSLQRPAPLTGGVRRGGVRRQHQATHSSLLTLHSSLLTPQKGWPARSRLTLSCRAAKSNCANAARRSSRPRSPAWPGGWSTSALPPSLWDSPAGWTQPWPCSCPARRWTLSEYRARVSWATPCPASARHRGPGATLWP